MAVTTFAEELFPEEGFRGIQVDFTDDDGNAVTPNADTIKWTLTNKPTIGTTPEVINSREQEDIVSASTIYIGLEGDDLALLSGEEAEEQVMRVLTVEWQYNSSTFGNNKDEVSQYIFPIENLYYKGN